VVQVFYVDDRLNLGWKLCVEVESSSKHVVYKHPRVHVREECDGEDDSIRTDATEMAQRDVFVAEVSEGAIEIGEVGTVLLGIESDDSAGEEPDLGDDEGGPGQDDASKDEELDSSDEDSPSPLQVEDGRLNLVMENSRKFQHVG
jgi:hypothetical protein